MPQKKSEKKLPQSSYQGYGFGGDSSQRNWLLTQGGSNYMMSSINERQAHEQAVKAGGFAKAGAKNDARDYKNPFAKASKK